MVPPNDMSFRVSASESRNLPKLQTLPCVGYYCNLSRFLHSACAAVGMTYRGVVPSIHTGYFCHVSGTAHRPFPTVSLKGVTIQPHRLYSERGGRQIAAPTVSLEGVTIQPHMLYPSRSRNGTQAVPYGFADWCILLHNAFQKRTRPSPIIVNCPLSIVNSK